MSMSAWFEPLDVSWGMIFLDNTLSLIFQVSLIDSRILSALKYSAFEIHEAFLFHLTRPIVHLSFNSDVVL